jgi:WD40 repeat protein
VSADGTQVWRSSPDAVQRFDRLSGKELWSASSLGFPQALFQGGAVDPITGRVFENSGEVGAPKVQSWTGESQTGNPSQQGIKADRTYDLREDANEAVAVDSKYLAVAGGDVAVIGLWGIDGYSVLSNVYPVRENPFPVNFSPNGSGLLVGSAGQFHRIDLSTGQVGPSLQSNGIGFAYAYLMSDDQVLGDTNSLDLVGGSATVSASSGETVTTSSEPLPSGLQAIDSAGKQVALSNYDESGPSVVVFDNTGHQIRRIDVTTTELSALSFSPDRKWLAIASSQQTDVFDIASGKSLLTIPGASNSVAFTADGHEVIVGGYTSAAQRYRTDTWTPIGTVIAHAKHGAVAMVARSDGLVVAAGLAKELRLSHIATGAPVGRDLLFGSLDTVRMSADGMKVARRNQSGTGIVIWDLNTAHWPAAACLAAGRNLSRAEWVASFGDEPYRVTCDGWPANG